MTSIGHTSVHWGRLVKLGRLLGDPGPVPRVVLAFSLATASVLWQDPLTNVASALPYPGLSAPSLPSPAKHSFLVASLPSFCLVAWFLFSFVVTAIIGTSPVAWIIRRTRSYTRYFVDRLLTGTGYCDPSLDTSATGAVRSPTHSRRGLESPSKTAWI